MTLILFCSDPLSPRFPDPDFQSEVDAARAAGFEIALIDFEALVHHRDPDRAVRRVPEATDPVLAVYRGWMLRPEIYDIFYNALAGRNVFLINDPAAYRHCHLLPESYSVIEGSTPRSVWIKAGPEVDLESIHAVLRAFEHEPVILKDFVKSRKHEWADACFIPDASDHTAVERVIRRFLELQGLDLVGGLVFREFIEFEPIGIHPKSGMPLTREHRIFWLDRKPVLIADYWPEGTYSESALPLDRFRDIAARVRSRLFSMDVARSTTGEWMIIELGDGQVAGLSDERHADAFYSAIFRQVGS